MLFDLSRLRRYFRRRSVPGSYLPDSPHESSTASAVAAQGSQNHEVSTGGGFSSGFIVSNSAMVDFSNTHAQQVVFQNIMNGNPGTRKKIVAKLRDWFSDPKRQWKGMWLYGPAGTGKPAIAQTFAEWCVDQGSLGAAFFSRPNERNKFKTVIPTIAYQLAASFPAYENLLSNLIARDLTLLRKTPRIQLKKLIIEPFSALKLQNHPITHKPLLILLNGLVECHGLKGQRELVEMIGEVIQLKVDLLFLWLICSRPEPNLKCLLSRIDFAIDCDRHQLLIDSGTREDVEQFLRDEFNNIQARFLGIIDGDWPSPGQFKAILDITDGLFLLGSATLKYIAFMQHAGQTATDIPLESLDLLYSRILLDVAEPTIPATRRILYNCIYSPICGSSAHINAQPLANLLGLDKTEFYNTLRSLHSVLETPAPEDALGESLKMYHASFKDFLCSPSRSGQFFADERKARSEYSMVAFRWYKLELELDGAVNFNGV
ncbi:hypothetical protein AN958_12057 [Leucoagaricus sp. SymC.cos]|nr:hypothetical protein AN958_12057 [Leucoagaricus sp. SymC.cos]